MAIDFDIAVIGAGLIGAAIASQLAPHRRVVLIERETHPGYHSSGRSAAILLPGYGGAMARALTTASVSFLADPPARFSNAPILTRRGALFVARQEELDDLERWSPGSRRLTAADCRALVPILAENRFAAGVFLDDVQDIDAAAMLQGFLADLRASGGQLLSDADVTAIDRLAGRWEITTRSQTIRAETIINAAGAWADEVATLAGAAPRGLVAMRRTVVVVDPPPDLDIRGWPLVSDAAETFYFKPEGGRVAMCPGDKTPVVPHDVRPDELDVAIAVDRLEAATELRVRRIAHQWAGLRTFAPDEEPIIGYDGDRPDFVWAAGFGGFGIQAAPAVGLCCDALIRGVPLPPPLAEAGVDTRALSPSRFGPSVGGSHTAVAK